jgi:hypothetical protein
MSERRNNDDITYQSYTCTGGPQPAGVQPVISTDFGSTVPAPQTGFASAGEMPLEKGFTDISSSTGTGGADALKVQPGE